MAENMEIHYDLQWHKCYRLLPEKKKPTPFLLKNLLK